jgi:hypothetical protein
LPEKLGLTVRGVQDEGGRGLHAALERAGLRVQYDAVAGADYYTLLGLAVDHGPEELKRAYKRMSKVRAPASA